MFLCNLYIKYNTKQDFNQAISRQILDKLRSVGVWLLQVKGGIVKRMETSTNAFYLRKEMEKREGRAVPIIEVAERAGINAETLRSYEKGRVTRFDARVIDSLMTFYKLDSYDQFFKRVVVDDEES